MIELKEGFLDSTVIPGEQLRYYVFGETFTIFSEWASCEFEKEEEGWHLGIVTSKKIGEGTRIVKEFVNYIGKGQKINAAITETSTEEKLRELGYGEAIKTTKERIVITDSQVFAQLKVTRMLQKAGITTDRLTVKEIIDPENGPWMGIYFYGHT